MLTRNGTEKISSMSSPAKQLSLDVGGTDFERYHADNPQVYQLFKKFAWQVIGRGFKNYSARAIAHRIRWHTSIETQGDEFKINNNYTSAYARMFEREYPEHRGFFRKRQSRYDE